MSRSETAAARVHRTTARASKPADVADSNARSHSTGTLLRHAALALPVGGAGFCVTPTGEWFDLWRESSGIARARRVSEDEVVEGLLGEVHSLEAESLGETA